MRRERTIIIKSLDLHEAIYRSRTSPILLFFRRLKYKHYREALEWVLNNPHMEDLL